MTIAPGFADATRESQRTFRAILAAMSRPGTMVAAALPAPPDGLSPAAAAALLTLCDGDTPVWLDEAATQAAEWLRFHSGAPVTGAPGTAFFAVVSDAGMLPPLDRFALGSDEYPDRSTTLIIETDLVGGPPLRLTGPGIDGAVNLDAGRLGRAFWEERADLAPLFPRGLDLLLTSGDRLTALPRSVRVDF
jgi:alpha-D-ribose 1-methylphosphonate 5-triphosphate synthase subunit PhnH